jgi:hypothetical protein
MSHRFLGFGSKAANDYQKGQDGKVLQNLFTLMVSATPYNLYTMEWIRNDHMLDWRKFLKAEKTNEPGQYQGLTKMKQNGKILADCSQANVPGNLWPLVQNQLPKEFIALLLDYVRALKIVYKSCKSQDHKISNNPTQDHVKRCIKENKLVVLRLEKAKNKIRKSRIAQDVLDKALKFFNFNETLVWTNSEDKFERNDSVKITKMSDLNDMSSIMILIERGRFGDTFPTNCICFDLRARYLRPVTNFTSFIQDVGRAFGYGDRPNLFLSKEANKFLLKIWDESTDAISWDELEAEKKVVLGYHMKRKKYPPDGKFDDKIPESFETEGPDSGESGEDEGYPDEIVEGNELENVQSIYEANKKAKAFLDDLGEHSFQHRFILKAEPQIGKTGAFLHLITLFHEKFQDHFSTRGFFKGFTRYVYVDATTDEIEAEMKTTEGRQDHKRYLACQNDKAKEREEQGILEPFKWAAAALIQDLTKAPKKKDLRRGLWLRQHGFCKNPRTKSS